MTTIARFCFAAWRRAAIAAACAAVTGCSPTSSGRYVAVVDPGSRYSFSYVMDSRTRKWVHREFEIRVDQRRDLPDPITSPDDGDRVSVQLFKPGSAQTGGIFSGKPAAEGGYLIWRGADVLHQDDLTGKGVAYGVGVSWPRTGEETKHDPMEIFPLPPLSQAEPEQWSAWATAEKLRAGAMGWWDETTNKPVTPVPPPMYPFEFRWRVVYAEVPGRIP